jgi:hypothetical protein
MNPKVIRAFTPVFLVTIGGAIGLAAVVCPLSDGQRSSGMGLAGTAIAEAAGIGPPQTIWTLRVVDAESLLWNEGDILCRCHRRW